MEENSPLLQNSCEKCGKGFVETKRLYRHLFDSHSLSKQEIEEFKKQRRNTKVHHTSVKKEKPVYPCEICGLPYLSKLGLNSHLIKSHNVVKPGGNNQQLDQVLCPINLCGKRFQTYFDLSNHCHEEHRNLVIDKEVFRIHRVRFENYDKFQDWKAEQEQQTESRFFTRSTETKCTYGRKTWFMKCLHTQKSSKTVDFYHYHCPAFVRVVERNSGKCEAVACFGHLGHPHYTQNCEVIEYLKREDPTDFDNPPPQIFSGDVNVEENDTPSSTFTQKDAEYVDKNYGTTAIREPDDFVRIDDEDFLEEDTSFTG